MRMKQRKKKMARPAGRTVKPVRRGRAKMTATTRPATLVRAPRTVTLSSRASLMAAMVVVTGAAILAARGVPSAPETPATDLHLEADAPAEAYVIVPEADAAERVIARAPAVEAKTAIAEAPTPPTAIEAAPPAAAEAPVPALAIETPIATTNATTNATTTVAGCLTFDDGSYRLKDATGTEAPKSRSWKSGFLKKNTVTIDIVDARHSLSLPSYVGQRVEVGGTLLEREMQAHSLQRLAESCKK